MTIIQFISINQFLFLDVSGGQSCSILDAMRSALQVSIHLSLMKDNYKALDYKDVFHMATLGGAAGTVLRIKSRLFTASSYRISNTIFL